MDFQTLINWLFLWFSLTWNLHVNLHWWGISLLPQRCLMGWFVVFGLWFLSFLYIYCHPLAIQSSCLPRVATLLLDIVSHRWKENSSTTPCFGLNHPIIFKIAYGYFYNAIVCIICLLLNIYQLELHVKACRHDVLFVSGWASLLILPYSPHVCIYR